MGRHVLITGGSSGIGKCLAAAAAERGADVTIVAGNEERLEKARDEIQAKVGSNFMLIWTENHIVEVSVN